MLTALLATVSNVDLFLFIQYHCGMMGVCNLSAVYVCCFEFIAGAWSFCHSVKTPEYFRSVYLHKIVHLYSTLLLS